MDVFAIRDYVIDWDQDRSLFELDLTDDGIELLHEVLLKENKRRLDQLREGKDRSVLEQDFREFTW